MDLLLLKNLRLDPAPCRIVSTVVDVLTSPGQKKTKHLMYSYNNQIKYFIKVITSQDLSVEQMRKSNKFLNGIPLLQWSLSFKIAHIQD